MEKSKESSKSKSKDGIDEVPGTVASEVGGFSGLMGTMGAALGFRRAGAATPPPEPQPPRPAAATRPGNLGEASISERRLLPGSSRLLPIEPAASGSSPIVTSGSKETRGSARSTGTEQNVATVAARARSDDELPSKIAAADDDLMDFHGDEIPHCLLEIDSVEEEFRLSSGVSMGGIVMHNTGSPSKTSLGSSSDEHEKGGNRVPLEREELEQIQRSLDSLEKDEKAAGPEVLSGGSRTSEHVAGSVGSRKPLPLRDQKPLHPALKQPGQAKGTRLSPGLDFDVSRSVSIDSTPTSEPRSDSSRAESAMQHDTDQAPPKPPLPGDPRQKPPSLGESPKSLARRKPPPLHVRLLPHVPPHVPLHVRQKSPPPRREGGESPGRDYPAPEGTKVLTAEQAAAFLENATKDKTAFDQRFKRSGRSEKSDRLASNIHPSMQGHGLGSVLTGWFEAFSPGNTRNASPQDHTDGSRLYDEGMSPLARRTSSKGERIPWSHDPGAGLHALPESPPHEDPALLGTRLGSSSRKERHATKTPSGGSKTSHAHGHLETLRGASSSGSMEFNILGADNVDQGSSNGSSLRTSSTGSTRSTASAPVISRTPSQETVDVERVGGLEITKFAQQVEDFVAASGGGVGSYFGPDNLFGLGVTCARIEGYDVDGNERGGMNLFVPMGFANGRELHPPPQAPDSRATRDEDFQSFVDPPSEERNVAFGRISWDALSEPSNYVRVPLAIAGNPLSMDNRRLKGHHQDLGVLPDLTRFFAERVWQLNRPRLLISVVGSSDDCDLLIEDTKALLAGFMKLATDTSAWILTNGLNSGVSKLIGQARAEANLRTPVIGVVPWGLVEGRQALWETAADGTLLSHCQKMVVENFGDHERSFATAKPHGHKSVRLSRQHSHFILVDDGTTGELRGEALFRANLEANIHSGSHKVQESIRQKLLGEKLGWQQSNMNTGEQADAVTTVCVVIEGGAGTINKVYEAICGGTAVLLCKGTGKTADLLCDACEFVEKGHLADRNASQPSHMEEQLSMNSEDGDSAECNDPLEHLSAQYSQNSANAKDPLIERVFVNNEDDEWLQDDVQKRYDVKFPKFDDLQKQIVFIASSGLCQVYTVASMSDGDSDLSGAMLVCALKKQKLFGHAWRDCLPLVTAWNHEGILRQLINCLKPSEPETRKALEQAFHVAFSENKVGMAEILLDFWDCTAVYDFKTQQVQTDRVFQFARLKQKTDKTNSRPHRNWATIVMRAINSQLSGSKQALQNWGHLLGIALSDDETRKLFEMQEKRPSWTQMFSAQAVADAIHSLEGLEKEEESRPNLMENVRRFEGVYREVLGEDWWYEMSTLGSLMDLFLFCVLMCRQDMCKMIWSRMDVPVRSSLLAATLYRKWSNRPGVKPHIRDAMIQYAAEFEEMSVQVQLLMMRHDSRMALDSLERPSRLWKGQTGVDLAILGGCRRFVEVCCAEALDSRWAGDLNPYRQPLGLYWTVASGVFSFGLLAPTLVAYREPPFAEALRGPTQKRKRPGWDMRFSTAEGISGSANDQLFCRLQKLTNKNQSVDSARSSSSLRSPPVNSWSSARKIDGVVAADLMSSSHLEFNFPWWERYRLFFAAPITIFVLDATFQLIQNLLFMVVLFSQVRAEKGFSLYEQVLMCFMISTTVTELVQILVESPRAYFATMWNWVRIGSCIFFWMGVNQVMLKSDQRLYPDLTFDFKFPTFDLFDFDFTLLNSILPFLALLTNGSNSSPDKNGSNSSSGTFSEIPVTGTSGTSSAGISDDSAAYTYLAAEFIRNATGDSWGTNASHAKPSAFLNASGMVPSVVVLGGNGHREWDEGEGIYYAAALFCMWFRLLHLLSVHQDLGPLVISVKRIAGDMASVAAIWGVLLFAFACAMQGTGIPRPACEKTSDGALLAENQSLECWSSWWLWRTYYQSFGQPFFDQLSSDSANAITIIMWPTMNLMLVNLLIALMNDTYVTVKDQSRLEWMIEMFHIAKEYRSPSRLNVIMLLNDVVIFIMKRKEINARMRQLQETPGVGIFGWYEYLRFKFRKFQSGDLPALGEKERLRYLTAELSQVSKLEGVEADHMHEHQMRHLHEASSSELLPPPGEKGGERAGSSSRKAAPKYKAWVSEEQKAKQARDIGQDVRHMLRSQTVKSFRKKSNSKFEAHFQNGGWGLFHPVQLVKLIFTSIVHLPARLVPAWQRHFYPMNLEELHEMHQDLYQKIKRRRRKVDKQRKVNDDATRCATEFLVIARNEFLRSRGTEFSMTRDDDQTYKLVRASKAARARLQAQMASAKQPDLPGIDCFEGSMRGGAPWSNGLSSEDSFHREFGRTASSLFRGGSGSMDSMRGSLRGSLGSAFGLDRTVSGVARTASRESFGALYQHFSRVSSNESGEERGTPPGKGAGERIKPGYSASRNTLVRQDSILSNQSNARSNGSNRSNDSRTRLSPKNRLSPDSGHLSRSTSTSLITSPGRGSSNRNNIGSIAAMMLGVDVAMKDRREASKNVPTLGRIPGNVIGRLSSATGACASPKPGMMRTNSRDSLAKMLGDKLSPQNGVFDRLPSSSPSLVPGARGMQRGNSFNATIHEEGRPTVRRTGSFSTNEEAGKKAPELQWGRGKNL